MKKKSKTHLFNLLLFISCYILTLPIIVCFELFRSNCIRKIVDWYIIQGMDYSHIKISIYYILWFLILIVLSLGFLILIKKYRFRRLFIKYSFVLLLFYFPTFTSLKPQPQGNWQELSSPLDLPSSRYSVIKPFGFSIINFLTKDEYDPFSLEVIIAIAVEPSKITSVIGIDIIKYPETIALWLELISIIMVPFIIYYLKKNLTRRIIISENKTNENYG